MAYQIYDDVNIRTTIPKYEQLERKADDGSIIVLKPFAMRMSLDAQLAQFVKMRVSDPARAKEIYELNEYVLLLAGQGSMRKLTSAIEGVGDPTHLLTYYTVKAFKAAILGGHLMVVNYFIDQGYPFHTAKVPHILLEIMAQTQSPHAAKISRGEGEGERAGAAAKIISEETCYALVEFLILKNRAINAVTPGTVTGQEECEIVNLAAKGNYLTPLHVAVRYGLFSVVDLLLSNGADVNAVGDGDAMPLPLAYKLRERHHEEMFSREHDATNDGVRSERVAELGSSDGEDASSIRRKLDLERSDQIDVLIRTLHAQGGRLTWRKDAASMSTTGTGSGAGTGAEYNVYKTSITENVFSTATAGAGIPAAANPLGKKRMVGFSGTVSKETTPTVGETLAALKLRDGNSGSSDTPAITGATKTKKSSTIRSFGSASFATTISCSSSVASTTTAATTAAASCGSSSTAMRSAAVGTSNLNESDTHSVFAMDGYADAGEAEGGREVDTNPASAYVADDGAQIFSTGM